MAVRKLFWEDPYLDKCGASVTGADGDEITLDRTVFYAFSGGQASDSGSIGGRRVIEARKSGKEILYTLEPGRGLKAGEQVEVVIDWVRRYRIMRLHFAAEIILELVYRNFGHPVKIGANITDEKTRVDFEWAGDISAAFPLLERKAGDIISSDLEIVSAFEDEEAELRYWQVEGFAKVPCGGTHIRRTGEVGGITLRRGKSLGKNKERIEIYLT
jgi:Ser-tRNA(Ala) deacylase AlaX